MSLHFKGRIPCIHLYIDPLERATYQLFQYTLSFLCFVHLFTVYSRFTIWVYTNYICMQVDSEYSEEPYQLFQPTTHFLNTLSFNFCIFFAHYLFTILYIITVFSLHFCKSLQTHTLTRFAQALQCG